jgi:homoserine dehydrogenase
MNKNLKIGLFGFGCVGQGLYDVLHQTKGIKAEIEKICIKDRNKKRSIDASYFTFEKNDILNNPTIDIIVELIDNADDAYEIVRTALKNGKAVVTANKKMLAEHFEELYQLQKETGVPLLYEGSVCGAIPIIRTLEEYYDNDLLNAIEGIFNGTTNYILTKTITEGKSYDEVLKEAQQLGFAESNPRLDVQAFDPKFKLCILIAHAFGVFVKPDDVLNYGIHHLGENDIRYAKEKGYKIRLIAKASKVGESIYARVLPQFVDAENTFYSVNNEYNAVQVEAAFADKQTFKGKGAGSHPTAAAVLSDISALTYNYHYEYKKVQQNGHLQLSNEEQIRIYLRFSYENVLDELPFSVIEERYQSKGYNYVVGTTLLSHLHKLDLNNRTDIFVAELINQTV